MLTFESFTGKKRVSEFNERLKEATIGLETSVIGTVDSKDIYKIVINPHATRTICFVAGIHGDEPAGPLGVLEWLESKPHVISTKRVVIIPLANPTGYELNTRENKDGVDINRKFDDKPYKAEWKILWEALRDEPMELLVTLHEDPDLKEFYLYYTDHKDLAIDLRDKAAKTFPIFAKKQRAPIEGEEKTLYDDRVFDGLIPLPHKRRGTLEDVIFDKGIPYITTETPVAQALKKRVAFTKDAIKMVINGI